MIFYFSATGNSLYAAQKIADTENDRLISIADTIKQKQYQFKLAPGERVGFVIPVYFYGLPSLVSDFIAHVSFKGNEKPYLYLLMTCGTSTGQAGKMFASQLNKSGFQLSAIYSVAMVDNYVVLFSVPSADKQASRLRQADLELATIAQHIKNLDSGDFNKHKGWLPSLVTAVCYPFYRYGRRTKKFYAKPNCTGCGLCQRICPSSAIKLVNNKPQWQQRQCVGCLGCLHRCPVKAIEYGSATAKRGRFVNTAAKWPQ